MKSLAILILFSLCVFVSHSQTPSISWQKALGGSGVDQANSINPTSDSGFIVGGRSQSNNGNVTGNHGSSDYWITKLSSAGAVQWEKSLGGSGDDRNTCVQQTSDGGYVAAGYSNSTDGDVTGNHGGYDFWIAKLDNSGSISWQKSCGGTGDDIANSITETADGGYIVAGYTNSLDGDVSGYHGGTADYWVIKLSSSGAVQWKKCFGGTGDDRATSIRQLASGDYILAGFSNSNNNDVSGNHGSYDYWILKLTSTGSIQWQKSLGGTLDDRAYSVLEASDGGIVVSGYAYSLNGDATNNSGSSDYWLVKLDASGTLVWQKSLGGSGTDISYSVIETSDKGYLAGGYSNSTNGDVSNNHGSTDYWLVKIDSTGNPSWEKTLGGSSTEYCYSIAATADSGFVVAGYTNSNDIDVSGNNGSSDFWIVKLNYITLPLSLLTFTAIPQENHNILISWTTSNEINNDYFTIQKSVDGRSLSDIGLVTANRKPQPTNHYSFTDSHVTSGTIFYRLMQTDLNGTHIYSKVVPVRIDGAGLLTIKPNPSRDGKFMIEYNEVKNNVTVVVSDNNGRMVFTEHMPATSVLNIDLKNKIGIYYLHVLFDGGYSTGKLIVQ